MASLTSDKASRNLPGRRAAHGQRTRPRHHRREFLVLVGPSGGTVKLASRKIKKISLATRCQLAGERDRHILMFSLAKMIMIKLNLTVPDSAPPTS